MKLARIGGRSEKYFHQMDAVIGVLLVTGAAWFVWSHCRTGCARTKASFRFLFPSTQQRANLRILISTWRARSPTELPASRRRYSSSPASKGRAVGTRPTSTPHLVSRVHRDTCSARGIAFRRVPLRRTRSRGRWPCLRKGELSADRYDRRIANCASAEILENLQPAHRLPCVAILHVIICENLRERLHICLH